MSECPSNFTLVRLDAGSLSESEQQAINGHVSKCSACHRALEDIRGHAAQYDAGYENHLTALRSRIASEERTKTESGRVIPFPRKAVVLGAVAATAMAAAASFLLLIGPSAVDQTPLPSYGLEASSGSLTMRGSEDGAEIMTIVPGTKLELIARPEVAVSGSLDARAFVIIGQRAEALDFDVQIDESGTAWIEAVMGQDLTLPHGATSLWLAVARQGAMPDEAAVAQRSQGSLLAAGPGYILLGRRVKVKE